VRSHNQQRTGNPPGGREGTLPARVARSVRLLRLRSGQARRGARRYPSDEASEDEMDSAAVADGLVIGVDVGGTKVAAGLVDGSGKIFSHHRCAMASQGTAARGLASVTSAIEIASSQADAPGSHNRILAVGICSPGPLDPNSGVVINPPNLPCWRNFPLLAEVARVSRLPVRVDNDANAAGLAETLWGAARGFPNVFYATIGTGIGTAILLGGRIYHGRTGAAAEGGHMTIDYEGPLCGCGKKGCIEAFASGPAIVRRTRCKLKSGLRSSILDMADGKAERVTCEMLGRALAAGDPTAKEVLNETIAYLACWFGNIVDLLEPDVMVVGGGVSSMLKPYFGEIQDRLPGCSVNQRCREIPLVPARYGEDAGIAGGAALCFGGVASANGVAG
jgi:glucokinase